MTKILRGLRGATTATANTSDAILEATQELLAALQTANGFAPEDVESAIFTTSPDLDADYPARAARRLGWTEVPLLGAGGVVGAQVRGRDRKSTRLNSSHGYSSYAVF